MNRKKNSLKKSSSTYFVCGRCRIDSLTKKRMCPCPRGGCEAVVKGTVVTETKITIYTRTK